MPLLLREVFSYSVLGRQSLGGSIQMVRRLFVFLAVSALFAVPAKSFADIGDQTLTGRVFCDENGDSLGDGDAGVAGVDIEIQNDNFGTVTVTTNANGVWTFLTPYIGDFF